MDPELRGRVGACAWTFGPIPARDALERIARLGFGGVELFGDLEGPTPEELRSMLDGAGLRALSITPANVDIAHPDDPIRKRAVDYYLRLVEHAAELGCAVVGCHGRVGRVRPLAGMAHEERLLHASVRRICAAAAGSGVDVAFEVLNRYESCHVTTASSARALLDAVEAPNLGILLDSYHMNIEEPDPSRAIEAAGDDLRLFHVADSNRLGIGEGHVDFEAQTSALASIGYDGPIVVECTAPGPDPFTPVKGDGYLNELERHLATSIERLGQMLG